MTEKRYNDVFKAVSSLGGALVGLGGLAIGALEFGKRFTKMRDEDKEAKAKEKEEAEKTATSEEN